MNVNVDELAMLLGGKVIELYLLQKENHALKARVADLNAQITDLATLTPDPDAEEA